MPFAAFAFALMLGVSTSVFAQAPQGPPAPTPGEPGQQAQPDAPSPPAGREEPALAGTGPPSRHRSEEEPRLPVGRSQAPSLTRGRRTRVLLKIERPTQTTH